MTWYTWDGAHDAVTWEDGRNWGDIEANYPKNMNDTAEIPDALAHNIVTNGPLTIGNLYMVFDCIATLTLGGPFIASDQGDEYGDVEILGGEFDTGADHAYTAMGWTFVGDWDVAGSPAKMTCHSSIVINRYFFQVGIDAEFDAPDADGEFLYDCSLYFKGVFNHNGGTLNHDGDVTHGHIYVFTDVTFNRIVNSSVSRYIRLDPRDGDRITTIEDGYYSTSNGRFHIKAAVDASHTIILGTASKSGRIDVLNKQPWIDDDGNGIYIQAADPAYPVIVTGMDWDWNMDLHAHGCNIILQDIDYRIAAITGGGEGIGFVTLTANRCRFAFSLKVSPGDTFHGTDVQIGPAPGGGPPGLKVIARGPGIVTAQDPGIVRAPQAGKEQAAVMRRY